LREKHSNSREEIAKEILGFFLRSPNVVDSFSGIVRWRLLEDAVDRSVASAEVGLSWLIQNEFLIEEKIAGSQSVYRLNPEKREEAEGLLESDEEP
jgi:hypothetical protein